MLDNQEVQHKLMAWQHKDEFWMTRAEPSPCLTKKQKSHLHAALKDDDYWDMEPAEKRVFRAQLAEIDASIHKKRFPAFVIVQFCSAIQGKGLYAAEDIPIGQLIGLYAGMVMDDDHTEDGNRYLFGIGDGYSIDAASSGNYTRAINNTMERYANTSAYKVKVTGALTAQIAFVSSKKIKKGQQILFSYGRQYFKALKIKPLILTPDTK